MGLSILTLTFFVKQTNSLYTYTVHRSNCTTKKSNTIEHNQPTQLKKPKPNLTQPPNPNQPNPPHLTHLDWPTQSTLPKPNHPTQLTQINPLLNAPPALHTGWVAHLMSDTANPP